MANSQRPSIVFVFADQMRSTALGCAGVEQVVTPNLDGFAQAGTRFTNAVTNTPVCSPARASLVTGLHVLAHGLVNNDIALRTDVRSIAHCLNGAGYRCGYIGKWHMDCADRGVFTPPGARRLGFDDYWAVNNCNHDYFAGHYYLNDDPTPRWFDCYQPDGETAQAVEYIRTRAGGSPFLLMLSWGPPHCPYHKAPRRFLDQYRPESIRLLPNAAPDARKDVIAGYYAHVSALDECFGRVLAAIEDAGIADDTIVVFTSDHGDMLFSQNRGWKMKPWRESVGIPLMVRWPGRVPAGRTTGAPISLVDLMPTLLSMAGVAAPPEVQGADLSAYVRGDEAAGPESAFINYPVCPRRLSYREWRGVVTRRHTYARFAEGPWVLYDDQADPFQLCNLADSPAHSDLRGQLEPTLQQWLARLGDRFETTEALAARFYGGQLNGEMPYYYNQQVQAGLAARQGRSY